MSRDLRRAGRRRRDVWRRPLVERRARALPPLGPRGAARVDRFVANSRTSLPRSRAATAATPWSSIRRSTSRASRGRGRARRDSPRSDYVTVSRLVPYKRIDVLVEAFRALPERRLVVVGDGPERARLDALAVPNVEFVGVQDDAATARRVAGGPRIPVRRRGGLRHRAGRGAGRGHAGDRLRPRRRARIDTRPRRRAADRRASSPRRRRGGHRRGPGVRGRRRAASRAAACRANALRFAPARFRDEIARVVDAAVRRTRRAALPPPDMRRNLLKENATLLDRRSRIADPLFVDRGRRRRLSLEFDTWDLEARYVDGAARRRAARVRRVPVAELYQSQRGVSFAEELRGAVSRMARDRGDRQRVPVPDQDRRRILARLGARVDGRRLSRARGLARRDAPRAARAAAARPQPAARRHRRRRRARPRDRRAAQGRAVERAQRARVLRRRRALAGATIDGMPVLGGIDRIADDLEREDPADQVWIALPLRAEDRIREVLDALRRRRRVVRFVPDIYSFHLLHHSVTEVAGLPVITLTDSPHTGHRLAR